MKNYDYTIHMKINIFIALSKIEEEEENKNNKITYTRILLRGK